MDIQLIKDHVFVTKVVLKGTIIGVSVGNGKELIDKGIAIDVTLQYQKQVAEIKAQQDKEQQEIADKADADRVDMLADKVAEKLDKKPKAKKKKKPTNK